mmetsp:Transcript_57467/g.168758  ORF Transcript_57467/g.168758 Transcript_57467/m.168758 type:complete len:226 (+) Transcript_57467:246-923(+)
MGLLHIAFVMGTSLSDLGPHGLSESSRLARGLCFAVRRPRTGPVKGPAVGSLISSVVSRQGRQRARPPGTFASSSILSSSRPASARQARLRLARLRYPDLRACRVPVRRERAEGGAPAERRRAGRSVAGGALAAMLAGPAEVDLLLGLSQAERALGLRHGQGRLGPAPLLALELKLLLQRPDTFLHRGLAHLRPVLLLLEFLVAELPHPQRVQRVLAVGDGVEEV